MKNLFEQDLATFYVIDATIQWVADVTSQQLTVEDLS